MAKQPPAWAQAVEDIRAAGCDKDRVSVALRYFNEHPQEAAQIWQSRGVTTEQMACVDGKKELSANDAAVMLVAAAQLSSGGVIADSVTGQQLIDKGSQFTTSMSCGLPKTATKAKALTPN